MDVRKTYHGLTLGKRATGGLADKRRQPRGVGLTGHQRRSGRGATVSTRRTSTAAAHRMAARRGRCRCGRIGGRRRFWRVTPPAEALLHREGVAVGAVALGLAAHDAGTGDSTEAA